MSIMFKKTKYGYVAVTQAREAHLETYELRVVLDGEGMPVPGGARCWTSAKRSLRAFVCLYSDGSVKTWDKTAGHLTLHHGLSDACVQELVDSLKAEGIMP